MSEHPEHQSKQEKKRKYRANFLWPHDDDSIEEAGYEFANGKTEEYVREWWTTLVFRIREAAFAEANRYASKQERMREAVRAVIAKWDHNVGRIMESMGRENPRVEAIDEAIEKLRAALSDVTEQKDLGDGPETLGQSGRATNINPPCES